MPWYHVSVDTWLQADDEDQAIEITMGELPDVGGSRPLFLISAGPAEELSDEQIRAIRTIAKVLKQAEADSEAGNLITVPGRPRVKLTPAVAATLAVLEAEHGIQ
jgi:hypothetical protein